MAAQSRSNRGIGRVASGSTVGVELEVAVIADSDVSAGIGAVQAASAKRAIAATVGTESILIMIGA